METQPPNNQSLSIYGSTEMTSDNELRDRIERIIDRAVEDWMGDPRIETGCNGHVAQAIVQEFGLTTETVADMNVRVEADGEIRYGEKTRVVGKWETQ